MNGEITSYEVSPTKSRLLVEQGSNLVVNTAYVAVAMAMKQDVDYGGFLYWAVGDGGTENTQAWDADVESGVLAPRRSNTKLLREIYRKAILPEDIVFLDHQGNPSSVPTNRLQITVVFDEEEPGFSPAHFREWGIFGGDATQEAESGYLINHRFHRTYEKTDFVKLERVLQFTF